MLVLLIPALLAGLLLSSQAAAAVDSEKVAKVKAAYLLNFLRFASFDDEQFDKPTSPFRILVIGEHPMGGILDATFANQDVNGRKVVIERHALPAQGDEDRDEKLDELADAMQSVHTVYVGDGDKPVLREVIHRIPRTVLSVGDHLEHGVMGCMLALNIDDGRVVFHANLKSIEASKVELSSRLLRLARPLPEKGDRD